MQSDEELIGELRLGNHSALEVLIRRHYKMVFAYTFRYVGDYHAAYDLTQDTLLKLVRAIHTLHNGESFKPWLLRIALNTCRDYLRSRSYKAGQQSAEYREELGGSWTSGQNVQLEDRMADRAEITDAMKGLPVYQREVIILRFYHDMKIKDIAEVTAVSEPTVKSRLKQGLAKLRKRLERSDTRAKRQDS
jgi:RNA polymerase sigma factor (sigma-70 family)